MPWSKRTIEASNSNVRMNSYQINIGNPCDKGSVTIWMEEQLEGDNFRRGKRWWFHTTEPIKFVSGFFNATEEQAKEKALQKAIGLLTELQNGIQEVKAQAALELHQS